MCHKFLGDTIDLHAGGTDLKFPHHENEIAQSECFTGILNLSAICATSRLIVLWYSCFVFFLTCVQEKDHLVVTGCITDLSMLKRKKCQNH
jgi:hypothetical protein